MLLSPAEEDAIEGEKGDPGPTIRIGVDDSDNEGNAPEAPCCDPAKD